MEEKEIDPIKDYWKLMREAKTQVYYADNVCEYYKNLEMIFKVINILLTIAGLMLVFSNLIEPAVKNIVLYLTIVVQILNLLYPYVFNFDKNIVVSNETRALLEDMVMDMLLEYYHLSIQKDDDIFQRYSFYLRKHTAISSKFEIKVKRRKAENYIITDAKNKTEEFFKNKYS